MKRTYNSALIIFIVLVLPAFFFIAAYNGVFKVETIEVQRKTSENSNSNLVVYDDYLNTLKKKLSPLQNQDLWSLDLETIKQMAQSEPWVQSVEIYRRFPQTLRVEVVAKPSVAVIYSKKGHLFLLSQDGNILPKIEETKAPKLPVIQQDEIVKNETSRSRIVKLLNQLPEQGPLALDSLSELSVNRKNEIWLTHLATQSLIKMGEENIGIKSARVEKVIEYLDQNNLNSRVIDADFSKKVLVKLRNDR